MNKVLEKFGNSSYATNDATFIMGINYLLAERITERFTGIKVALDTCCGAGFMSIALAKVVNKVIAVDINAEHLEMAIKNSEIAGIRDKINFVKDNVLELGLKKFNIDGAFLDPDWANTDEKRIHVSRLSQMNPSGNMLFDKINKITQNIVLRLPKEFDLSEIKNFPQHEIEKVYLDNNFKFYCVYFGNFIQRK